MSSDLNGNSDFKKVCAEDDIEIGKAKRFVIGGTPIALYHLEDGFYAIEDSCSHAGASLAFGQIEEGGIVACPNHGAKFDIKTGEVLSLPAVRGVRSYEVKVENGDLFVRRQPVSIKIPSIMRLK